MTFLTAKTTGLVKILGYTLMSNHRQEHKGGGMAILIKNGIPHKRRHDLDIFIEKHTESTFIEINTKCGMPVVIGSMYQKLNTPADKFTKHTSEIMSTAKQEKKTKRSQ